MRTVYCVCGLGYDENDCITDYEMYLGDFNNYEEAYEFFVKLQRRDSEWFFRNASDVYQVLLQLEECEDDGDEINCTDVKNEWWITNPNYKEETKMNVWYAIANCEEPEGIYEEFWKWDTKYDVGYEPSSYDELFPYADKCSTIEGAESRAKDVLSTIWDDEVYIVRVYEDEDGDMDYTEFIKIVNRNDKEEI